MLLQIYLLLLFSQSLDPYWALKPSLGSDEPEDLLKALSVPVFCFSHVTQQLFICLFSTLGYNFYCIKSLFIKCVTDFPYLQFNNTVFFPTYDRW